MTIPRAAKPRSPLVASWRRHLAAISGLAVCGGGCTPSATPALTSALAPLETGSADAAVPRASPVETTTTGDGTPTEVYSQIARAARACWFAANGALKETHIFHADAAPPSQGGDAEIVLHERDTSLRDQRGARALRIAIARAAGGTQVRITVVKLAPAMAELMVSDVEVWAKGGAGCRARALSPASAKSPVRTRASSNAQR